MKDLKDPRVLKVLEEKVGPLDLMVKRVNLEFLVSLGIQVLQGTKETRGLLVFWDDQEIRESEDTLAYLANEVNKDLEDSKENEVDEERWDSQDLRVILASQVHLDQLVNKVSKDPRDP